MSSTRVLRHSKLDSLLVVLSLVHGAVLLVAPTIPVIALGVWWNSNTVSHHFLHLPFFRSRIWNRGYALYLSVLLGIPQSLWRQRHLSHHGDIPMRFAFTSIVAVETGAVLTLWTTLIAVSPEFFAFVYLPGYLVGLGLCYLHGYYEHARGTTSYYGALYNMAFFNDGYHVEHHSRPTEHWSRVPSASQQDSPESRWPAILRWMDAINLETLERLALRFKPLQQFLLRTHEQAIRKLLPGLETVRSVRIVGGGMYPRTALLLRLWLPEAAITILDANHDHLVIARPFMDDSIACEHGRYSPAAREDVDLLIIPLSFDGDREAVYQNPPAKSVLVHDWIWSKRGKTAMVSLLLLKRMNLVVR